MTLPRQRFDKFSFFEVIDDAVVSLNSLLFTSVNSFSLLFRLRLQQNLVHIRLPTRLQAHRPVTWGLLPPLQLHVQCPLERSTYEGILQQSITVRYEFPPADLLQLKMSELLHHVGQPNCSRRHPVGRHWRSLHVAHLRQGHRVQSHLSLHGTAVSARAPLIYSGQMLSHMQL